MWKFKAHKITAGKWILTQISLLIKKVFVVGTCLEARNQFLQCSVTGFTNYMPRRSWPTKKQSPCLILFWFYGFFWFVFFFAFMSYCLFCICLCFNFDMSVFIIMFIKYFNRQSDKGDLHRVMGGWRISSKYIPFYIKNKQNFKCYK